MPEVATLKSDQFCSDSCFEEAKAGKSSYAPCPLVTGFHNEWELCKHCGYYITEDRFTTHKQFNVGDRVFSHYTRNTARGVSGWGTIRSIDRTYRNKTHGVTGSPLPDTTWYTISTDEGSTELLDDAHGNWDMARIVPEHIARRYGYGADPKGE